MQALHKLSIIVPCHNVAEWIPKLIESLNAQTSEDFEVIFVLDDCTDNTAETIIEQFTRPYTILHCNEHNCGTARNIGIEESDSEWIWFIDADDWVTRDDAVEYLLSIADSNDIIQFDYKSQGYDWYCHQMVWQRIVRRDLIGETRFRREMPGEDGQFTDDIYAKAVSPIRIHEVLYHYNYPREGSVMDKVRNGMDPNAR